VHVGHTEETALVNEVDRVMSAESNSISTTSSNSCFESAM
jgi:hypothetical protein